MLFLHDTNNKVQKIKKIVQRSETKICVAVPLNFALKCASRKVKKNSEVTDTELIHQRLECACANLVGENINAIK
jgi:hypothetical protein